MARGLHRRGYLPSFVIGAILGAAVVGICQVLGAPFTARLAVLSVIAFGLACLGAQWLKNLMLGRY